MRWGLYSWLVKRRRSSLGGGVESQVEVKETDEEESQEGRKYMRRAKREGRNQTKRKSIHTTKVDSAVFERCNEPLVYQHCYRTGSFSVLSGGFYSSRVWLTWENNQSEKGVVITRGKVYWVFLFQHLFFFSFFLFMDPTCSESMKTGNSFPILIFCFDVRGTVPPSAGRPRSVNTLRHYKLYPLVRQNSLLLAGIMKYQMSSVHSRGMCSIVRMDSSTSSLHLWQWCFSWKLN